MKSLFKTVFIIIFFSVLTRLLGFVFRIWLSRTIGAEALGIYQISFSIFMILLTIISSGLPLIVSKTTAKYQTNKNYKEEHSFITASTIIAICLSVFLSIIILVFQKPISYIFTDKRCLNILLVLLPALIFSSIYSIIRGNLWGKNKYTYSCGAELFEQVVRNIACIFLISGIFGNMSGEIAAGLSLSVACFFSCIFVLILYFKSGGKFTKPKYFKEIIKTSTPITSIRIISSLIQPIISIILPLRLVSFGYTTSQAVSLFGIISGMTIPLLFIPLTIIGSLSYALVPDLSSAYEKKDEEYISSRINISIIFSLVVAFFVVPIFIGAGENIGIFFFDNSPCGYLLSYSAWIVVPLCLTNITSTILNSVGLEIKSFKNYIVGGIIMFISIWFLPKYLGISALTISMGLCFSICSILNLVMIKRKVCKTLNFKKQFLKLLLFVIPTASITSFLTSILAHFLPLFFNLLISCTVGAIFFVLLCLIFNLVKLNQILKWLKDNKLTIKFKKSKKIV